MDYLPIFLDIRAARVLVVGGGEVAARKVGLLQGAGARVVVVSPELGPALTAAKAHGTITHIARPFTVADVAGARIVIAATNHASTNKRVYQAATAARVPVNVVDHPALCTFIMPSIIDRSPVLVAVSSGGTSPVLARLLRARLESLVASTYGALAAFMARRRPEVRQKITSAAHRRRFWERVLQGPAAELLLAGQEAAAADAFERELAEPAGSGVGLVSLVGAGPGDPDLLTLRALRLMQEADVVVHDRLVAAPILALCRREAQRIDVGKDAGHHAVPQGEINRLLVELGASGRRVVRLKGGDPFVFGRGGEEIDALVEAGIPFQVVPGITAALGCAAYGHLPLTHRDYAQSCVFVTGHCRKDPLTLNWQALAQPRQTLVFYMGVAALPGISRELMAHGLPGTTPAALIERGTTPTQRVLTGTLATLPGIVAEEAIEPPTLIVIGEVVRLHERWTRRADEALTSDLRAAG
ncbi:siroheme synthase CysG [Acidiferrobacter sp.]|uniref:siroheme synthase CysG n=1 Tax=Acidiferrobacter sp. TaxID=1872107 RepID=UPI002620AAAF|nr:siroheme synthase CysG [Acidiferrobacter sp.]